eukprot:Skav224789  [mRNA]  locus=scaffold764:90069:91052:- [translate_table: standard]
MKITSWNNTPYVRGGRDIPARGARKEQAHWRRTENGAGTFGSVGTKIVRRLIGDKMLPNWSGKTCPKCNKGTLSSLKALPLQYQTAILLFVLARVSLASIHLILGVNHKVMENLQEHLEQICTSHALQKEKTIVFGAIMKWADVEGDEATFDKRDISADPTWAKEVQDSGSLLWEQRSGLVQRGKPQSLVLNHLNPSLTVARAPGPGPITTHDWTPCVLHASAVHHKKRAKKNGKWQWTNPSFVKMKTHKLPSSKAISVKCGTW